MEVYTLDSLLRRAEVVDHFESLIWTERWAAWGDFQMQVRSSFQNRSLLTIGTRLAMNRSKYVMTIETIEDGVDSEGRATLDIRGRSLEASFDSRAARGSTANLTTTPTWDLNGPPATVARQMVHDVCVTGVLSIRDKFPYLVESRAPSLPASTITEPPDPIKIQLEPQTLYKALTDLCNTWTLGFRLIRDSDSTQLYFDVYTGVDRTSSQVSRPVVIFSPELDNLTNTKELNTIENWKNVAYVFSPVGYREVVAADVDPTVDGFDRRVLIVKADDVTSGTEPEIQAALLQRGKEALAEARAMQALDGEIHQKSQYQYATDYWLGDLVEMRNSDGEANQMRVTEQIFTSDREGERIYPTLALNTFIRTGTWLSFEPGRVWLDYNADMTTVWGILP